MIDGLKARTKGPLEVHSPEAGFLFASFIVGRFSGDPQVQIILLIFNYANRFVAKIDDETEKLNLEPDRK